MRITAVDVFLVEVPFRDPFVVWRGSVRSKQHVLLKVSTDDGTTGWGEAAPFLYYAPETANDVFSMVVDVMRDQLIGLNVGDVRAVMTRFVMIDGHEFAKAALETALWDLLGQKHGLPVYRLLGGASRESIPVLTVLKVAEPEAMANEAVEWVASGLGNLKLKIGFGADRDEEMVARVREAVGPDVRIRADAEEHYTVKEALKIGLRLSRYNLELLSQPVHRGDWEGMALLRQRLDIPVLADEGIHCPQDVLTCIRASAADMVNIKVLKCGGALHSMEMGALCGAAHLPVVIGSMIETGIGTLMGAHVAMAMPSAFSTELCGPFLLADDLLETPVRIENGHIRLGDSPGLGARVDEADLEQHLVF